MSDEIMTVVGYSEGMQNWGKEKLMVETANLTS